MSVAHRGVTIDGFAVTGLLRATSALDLDSGVTIDGFAATGLLGVTSGSDLGSGSTLANRPARYAVEIESASTTKPPSANKMVRKHERPEVCDIEKPSRCKTG